MCKGDGLVIDLAGNSKADPALRRSLRLALAVLGALALVGWGAPDSWAGPAQEEYELQIPDPRGGDGSSTPDQTRAQLRGGERSFTPAGASNAFSTGGGLGAGGGSGLLRSLTSGASGSGASGSADDGEALLAQAREGRGSGLLSAGASAAWSAPFGLAVAAILLLITFAAMLAVRRSRRIGARG